MLNSKQKETVANYTQILASLNRIKDGAYVPKMTKDFWEEYDKKKKGTKVNLLINENKHNDLVTWIRGNDLNKVFVDRLSFICGSVLQSDKEVDNFLNGLASDSWIFSGSTTKTIEVYRRFPELVMVRLLELVTAR